MEKNNDHYEIEWSADGKNFTKIGEVISKAEGGNSEKAIQYEFSKTIAASGALLSIPLFLLGCLLLIKRRKNRALYSFFSVCLLMAAYSCNKRSSDFIDNGDGTMFIRVLQVDKDGKKSYSKVVKVVRS